jgi:phosphoribosylaminoimidazole carboxylase (NCAIR synthetase)
MRRVGILGGGQLARMTVQAAIARRLNVAGGAREPDAR